MSKAWWVIGFIVILAACDRDAGSQTPAKTLIASTTTTGTPPPTLDLSPDSPATPHPPLSPQGPHLIYDLSIDGYGPFVILDADGRGRGVLELPEGGYVDDLQSAISWDGNWLAFYSGFYESPYDLALNLLYLPDGTFQGVTLLLSDDYPQNLSLIAETLPTDEPNTPTMESWIPHVQLAFRYGIMALAWSPDGQTLAFSGQMDGPSSDLYLYDLETSDIKRLTDDLENIGSIEWSPDGDWILFTNSIPGAIYQGAKLYALKPEEGASKALGSLERGYWWRGEGWAASNTYLLSGTSDGGGLSDLRYLDVETGEITLLWDDLYIAYAINKDNNQVALSSDPSRHNVAGSRPNVEAGTYLISFDGDRRLITEDVFAQLVFWGGSASSYIGADGNKIVAITEDGTATFLSDRFDSYGRAGISVSPDYRWLALFNEDGLELFSDPHEVVRTVSDLNVTSVIWRPDSRGLFLLSGDVLLYYLPALDGDPVLIDSCQSRVCGFYEGNFAWLP